MISPPLSFQIRIAVMALFAFTGGCRTTDEHVAVAKHEAPVPTPAPVAPPARGECPIPDAVCTMDFEPVLCTADTYRGRSLPTQHVLMAWGRNACHAKLDLRREACARGMLPSALGRQQCVPDPSAGHCPPTSLPCPEVHTPSVCSASGYGEQDLKGDQILRGWGRSACDATQRLQMEACRRHLDPVLLRKIVCGTDPSDGECALPDPECEDAPRKTTCTAQAVGGKKLAVNLEASGPSPCAAKQALARLACRQDVKPSRLDQVVCRAGG